MRLVRFAANLLLGAPVLLLAAACAGAGLAAQMGRSNLTFDILTHFAPLWLAGSLAALLVAALLLSGVTRFLALGLSLVGVASAGVLVAPELVRDTGPTAAPGAPGQLKLIQFNVWNQNVAPQKTADWIASESPDIVVLEEAQAAVRKALAAQGGWHVSSHAGDVLILSRAKPLPPSERERHDRRFGPLWHASFRDDRGIFTVVGAHNAWPTDALDQQGQEIRIARLLQRFPRERTILAGDFNSTPWSFARRRRDQAFGLIRRDRAVFSWPAEKLMSHGIQAPFPFLPIDHVYAGEDWATVSVRRGPKLGSDHYPLVVTLAPVARR